MQNFVLFFGWFASALYVLIGSVPGYFIGQAWRRSGYLRMIGPTFTPARLCYVSERFLSEVPHLSRRSVNVIPLPFESDETLYQP